MGPAHMFAWGRCHRALLMQEEGPLVPILQPGVDHIAGRSNR